MTKSKVSLYNAIASIAQMLIQSLVGLILGKSIIDVYGSDYNGINSTITQIVGTLTIFEAGFVLASNVALFEPFAKHDVTRINGILSATHRRFRVIGLLILGVGALMAVIYPFTVDSAMPKWMIGALLMTVVISTAVNLGVSMKYRVLIQAAQKEYVISVLTTIPYAITNLLCVFLIYRGVDLLTVRVLLMLGMIAGFMLVVLYCRRVYPYVDVRVPPMYDQIKGTKNVVVLKVMSVFYSSVPLVVVSTIPQDGALLASVYAVYRTVIYMIKNAITALCNAPRLSFGAMFAEGDEARVREYFEKYEMITCIALCVLLGTTAMLLLPFVALYTAGATDVQYIDIPLALIFLLTSLVEVIHIPSGQIIQMKGDFKASRNIQTIAFVALLVTMLLGRIFFGVYGIAASVLVAALVLAVGEIAYAGVRILHRRPLDLLRNLVPCLVIFALATFIGLQRVIPCQSYLIFALWGIVLVTVTSLVTLAAYALTRRRELLSVIRLFWHMLVRRGTPRGAGH